MARKKRDFQWVRDPEEGVEVYDGPKERPNRSKAKRELRAHDDRIDQMLAMPRSERAVLPLDDDIKAALELLAAAVTGPARKRIFLRMRSLMCGIDIDVEALDLHLAGETPAAALGRDVERWRQRIVRDGDPAIQAFLDEHPGADRQQLRALTRAAVAAGGVGKPFRDLYVTLRKAIQA